MLYYTHVFGLGLLGECPHLQNSDYYDDKMCQN